METIHRIGTFFILVGLALLVMFIGSIMSKDINVIYLFLAFAALFIAFLLRRNKPVNDSGRFGAIRRASARSRQRREDQKNKKSNK
jgi:Ca2+/Na+ antiporter